MSRIHELVLQYPRFGYRRITVLLQREGFETGFDRVYRLWRREGLKVPKKARKKRRLGSSVNRCNRVLVEGKNHVWAWDFIFDRTSNGTSLKWLSVVDEFTRECLCLKVARRMTSQDIIDVLRGLFVAHGVPAHIRSDNGPELMLRAVVLFVRERRPRVRPTQDRRSYRVRPRVLLLSMIFALCFHSARTGALR